MILGNLLWRAQILIRWLDLRVHLVRIATSAIVLIAKPSRGLLSSRLCIHVLLKVCFHYSWLWWQHKRLLISLSLLLQQRPTVLNHHLLLVVVIQILRQFR